MLVINDTNFKMFKATKPREKFHPWAV